MTVTVAFVCETAPGERRAALTPETCKKLLANQVRVVIERGAGKPAGFPDNSYVGAEMSGDRAAAVAGADVLVCVQPPPNAELARMKSGAVLVGLLAILVYSFIVGLLFGLVNNVLARSQNR